MTIGYQVGLGVSARAGGADSDARGSAASGFLRTLDLGTAYSC